MFWWGFATGLIAGVLAIAIMFYQDQRMRKLMREEYEEKISELRKAQAKVNEIRNSLKD